MLSRQDAKNAKKSDEILQIRRLAVLAFLAPWREPIAVCGKTRLKNPTLRHNLVLLFQSRTRLSLCISSGSST